MPLVLHLLDEARIMHPAMINRRLNGAHVANLMHDGVHDVFGIIGGGGPRNLNL